VGLKKRKKGKKGKRRKGEKPELSCAPVGPGAAQDKKRAEDFGLMTRI